MRDDDRLIRGAFDELRRKDAERTPPFHLPVPGRARSRIVWAAAAALVILVAAIVLRDRPQPDYAAVPPMDWKAPTDFLLDTPGSSLVRSVPRIPSPVPDYSLKGTSK